MSRTVFFGLAAVLVLTLQPPLVASGELQRWHRQVGLGFARQNAADRGAGVRVGVLDTDIDQRHFEFEDRARQRIRQPHYRYLDPGDHGTQVAGIIAAARDGRGTVGMAPEARIVSAWYLDDDLDEAYGAVCGSLVPWVRDLLDRRVDVINASLGPGRGSEFNSADGLRWMARARGQAVVAIAAGNDGRDLRNPACGGSRAESCRRAREFYGHVLVVGALARNGRRLASFSNRPGHACFHRRPDGSCRHPLKRWFLAAPGTGIEAPVPHDDYDRISGTSAAAPIVSGAAALLMSKWPHLQRQPRRVARILLKSADDLGRKGVDAVYGHGRLDVGAALAPLGARQLATGARVGGPGVALERTALVTSSAFGRSLTSAMAGSEAVLFDDFGRDFAFDPTALAHAETATIGAVDLFDAFVRSGVRRAGPRPQNARPARMTLAAESDPYGHLPRSGFMLASRHGPVQFGFATDHDARPLANLLDGEALPNDPITAFRADGHHLDLVGPSHALGGTYAFGGEAATVGLVIASRSSAPHEEVLAGGDDALGVELTGRVQPAEGLALRTRVGFVQEEGSALGSEGRGAFALDGSDSFYLGAGFSAELGRGVSLHADLETGWSAVQAASSSLIRDGQRVRTETARLGVTGRTLLQDADLMSFGIAQPLRIADGDLEVRLPVGRTRTGRVLYQNAELAAEPEGRELRLTLDYAADLPAELGRWQVAAIERLAPGHDASRPAETLLFGKVAFAF